MFHVALRHKEAVDSEESGTSADLSLAKVSRRPLEVSAFGQEEEEKEEMKELQVCLQNACRTGLRL